MKAILLAAGTGTRLRPLTDTIPKCLVPIGGRPLLDIWLDMLSRAGCGPFLVNTHYLADKVRSYLAKSPYAEVVQETYEPDLLGTGGTLLAARKFVGGDPVMLVHADNLSRFDVSAFIEAHRNRSQGCVMTMMLFETDAPQTCGIVELDRQGVVQAFHEKVADPPGRLANGAVYIVEPDVIEFLRGLGKPVIDFSTEVIPHYLSRIATWVNSGYHRDIGNPESYAKAQKEYASLSASEEPVCSRR